MVSKSRLQYGALAYRVTKLRQVEVLLITSRQSKTWIIPKGWPMEDRSAAAVAAQEAMEEAGVLGRVEQRPAGSFHYKKQLSNGVLVPCEVQVFPLKVTRQQERWPEQSQRRRSWFNTRDAAKMVKSAGLKKIIRSFEALLKNGTT